MNRKALSILVFCLLGVMSLSTRAEAFCGFYVGGAGAKLYSNATQVVMMREGKRTVLSMQNNYQGPPSNFAMVIPVPVVLQKENVKTLPRDVFDRVDQMASPRLVEYWEQDPCFTPSYGVGGMGTRGMGKGGGGTGYGGMGSIPKKKKVVVKARFTSGEYEIVILSATESAALETWLRQNQYNIPKGAKKAMAPYIEQGMYFFVAKVNVDKVKFGPNNQATLSPLRFHYDSDTFSLPIRLGLLNAKGKQDLIVHILARNQRYEVANAKNVTIPTNITVGKHTSSTFGAFYTTLFDRTLAMNPGAVVTEYAWDASTCDPCPGPRLRRSDFVTLGDDVLSGSSNRFVLTRLHARYDAKSLGRDLVFKAAPPIVGGRQSFVSPEPKPKPTPKALSGAEGESLQNLLGTSIVSGSVGTLSGLGVAQRSPQDFALLERGSQPGSVNNFQGRYIIQHAWTKPITCKDPRRNIWVGRRGKRARPAPKIQSVPKSSGTLQTWVRQDIPELRFRAKR